MKKTYRFFIIAILVLGLQSCTEKYFTEEGISGIFIQLNANSRIIGQELSISVKTESGEDITADAIIYANDEVLSSPTFTTEEIGIVRLRAVYLNIESSLVEVEYHDGSQTNFKKNVLIEDYTGTWCGWCPRVSYAMKLLSEQTDAAVFVAIHRAPVGLQDPYIYEDADELEQLINTPGYPKGFINRLTQWDFPEPDNVGQAIAFTQGANPKLGLRMSSSLDANQISLDVDAYFANDFEGLKLVVYLLENGLIYPQVNYTSYYGGENPIESYVHDYTLRETLTDIIGDNIPSSSTQRGLEYNKNFTFTVPDNVEDVNQIDFVAFLTDADGNVINVRRAALGESQEFEILE
jgi:hypothetical protein